MKESHTILLPLGQERVLIMQGAERGMKKDGYTVMLTVVSLVAMTVGVFVSINELQRYRVLNHYKKESAAVAERYAELLKSGVTRDDVRIHNIKARVAFLKKEMADFKSCWHVRSLVIEKQKQNEQALKTVLAASALMIDVYKKAIKEYQEHGIIEQQEQAVFAASAVYETLSMLVGLEKRFARVGYASM